MGGTVQIFWNNPNKSKFYYEELRSILKTGAGSCAFQFAIKKYKA
jgi:hypothetical protein